MYIECYDENTKIIKKKVEVFVRENKIILSVGFPHEWELETFKKLNIIDNIICIDSTGINYHKSPVYCDYNKLMNIADSLLTVKNKY